MGPRREAVGGAIGVGGPALLARLSAVVRTVTSGDLPEGASLAARARFLSKFARHRRRRPTAGVAWSSASLVAAGAAAAHLVQPASTALGVDRGALENGYVSGGVGPENTLRFPGGPSVDLAPESRGRVREMDAARARVVLEGGHATVHGAAHPFHDVLIVAGPYAVTSRGAQFDVSWSGDAIDVHVAAGAVTVAGPVVTEGLTVHAGQSFAAREAAWELRCF
jgi:ferric-dicitrate binding protein FerR (iron transport regulator)